MFSSDVNTVILPQGVYGTSAVSLTLKWTLRLCWISHINVGFIFLQQGFLLGENVHLIAENKCDPLQVNGTKHE